MSANDFRGERFAQIRKQLRCRVEEKFAAQKLKIWTRKNLVRPTASSEAFGAIYDATGIRTGVSYSRLVL